MKHLKILALSSLVAIAYHYFNYNRRSRQITAETLRVVGKQHEQDEAVRNKRILAAPSFLIKSTHQTSGGDDLCIQVKNIADGSYTDIRACDPNSEKQVWETDVESRLRLVAANTKCLTRQLVIKPDGTKNKRVRLLECGQANKNNRWILDKFENTVAWKRNGFQVIGVNTDRAIETKPLRLQSRSATKFMQNWNPSSVPAVFLIRNKVLSSGSYLCIETASLDIDAILQSRTCNVNEEKQQWISDGGHIQAMSDTSKCIVWGGTSKLSLGSCGTITNKVTFMFNTLDDTLLLKRNGNKAISITSGSTIIVLAGRRISAPTQQWTLENILPAPPTKSPTESPTKGSSTSVPTSSKPNKEVVYKGNPCTDMFSDTCAECTGDCDKDIDCAGSLRCAQRSGSEIVPGCTFPTNDRKVASDFCFLPIKLPGIINYVGECGTENYPCGICEGDCDSDSDCEPGLICRKRSGFEAAEGCTGEGGDRDVYAKDICIREGATNYYGDSLTIQAGGCSAQSPCPKCAGSCSSHSDCHSGLQCFQRSGSEPVPNCVTGSPGDIPNRNYCFEPPTSGEVTYIPGQLSYDQYSGLKLSTGLQAKLIAQTGISLLGTQFHGDPDASAVFPIVGGSNNGGWIYVSNAEKTYGGVGAITFNSFGNVVKYNMIMTGTSQNCGGGKTYWGTWVSCEEHSSGQVHEVDPYVGTSTQRQTVLGGSGGAYESFAYDARNRMFPTFYVTHDSSDGAMVRFTPNPSVVQKAESTGDYRNVLTTMGTLEWLVLLPWGNSASALSGEFKWIDNRRTADSNASEFYRNSEGIDIRDGILYFTTKVSKSLYILDLDLKTYTRSSTEKGAFSGQPDQIQRILASDKNNDMLYFCEEAGGDNGVHARDNDGKFYQVIDGGDWNSETSGLAFSPDNKHMYVSYQSNGLLFDITREDGYPFGAHRLDIKYHAQ